MQDMNNDLISRDYVVMVYNRVKEACKNCDNCNGVRCRACDIGDELLDLQDIIDNAPTALFPLTVKINDNVTDEDIENLKRLMKDYKPQILNLETEKPQVDIFPMEFVAGKCPIEVGGNCPLKPQGDLTDEVWKLYKKHQSHLATHVLEFGEELADLLGKYNEGGAE